MERYLTLKIEIPNRLSFDVEFYAKKLLNETEKEIGDLYPSNEQGKKPLVYYWAREANCGNPSCKTKTPLLKHFYLSKKNYLFLYMMYIKSENQYIYLNPIIKDKNIDFEIKYGRCDLDGWNQRTNLTCPVCGSVTDSKSLKNQFKQNQILKHENDFYKK